MSLDVVYFSNTTENTHRFVEKLGLGPASLHRIPLRAQDEPLKVERPFVLVTPTYGSGRPGTAVPKQVIRFLNDADNRQLLQGVVAGGNVNFGDGYASAGEIIAAKCNVPYVHRFEILGLPEDVARVAEYINTETDTSHE